VLVLDMGYNLIEELPPNAFHLKPANNSMSIIFTGNQVKKLNSHVFSGVSTHDRIVLDDNSMDRLAPGVFDGVRRVNVLNLFGGSERRRAGDGPDRRPHVGGQQIAVSLHTC
jgi:hypothetical protein